jgi:hypothetical protein
MNEGMDDMHCPSGARRFGSAQAQRPARVVNSTMRGGRRTLIDDYQGTDRRRRRRRNILGSAESFRPRRVVFRNEGCATAGFHLRRILAAYSGYYNELRPHLSLEKDSPGHRPVQQLGQLSARPILGGLHHRYCRM